MPACHAGGGSFFDELFNPFAVVGITNRRQEQIIDFAGSGPVGSPTTGQARERRRNLRCLASEFFALGGVKFFDNFSPSSFVPAIDIFAGGAELPTVSCAVGAPANTVGI